MVGTLQVKFTVMISPWATGEAVKSTVSLPSANAEAWMTVVLARGFGTAPVSTDVTVTAPKNCADPKIPPGMAISSLSIWGPAAWVLSSV